MMSITFNGFNARTSHINPFENLGRNKNFLLVMLSIFLLQFVFVTFGGQVLSVERLNAKSWLICLVLAFMVIPIDVCRKALFRSFRGDSVSLEDERQGLYN
jgi:membrane protein CcdC involved in cytochrome C biogenesis